MSFTDVYDGSEITVEIGEYDDGGSTWNYSTVAFRRGLNIDNPDNTRAVYDGLKFKGNKETRADKSLDVSQEFMGFGEGLDVFSEKDALVAKVTITPHDGSTPTVPTRYYNNWCTQPLSLDDIPDEGEVGATLAGRFDTVTETEPTDDSF